MMFHVRTLYRNNSFDLSRRKARRETHGIPSIDIHNWLWAEKKTVKIFMLRQVGQDYRDIYINLIIL